MQVRYEKIRNLCSNITSGGTPLSSHNDYYHPEEIPWLKSAEVKFCRIYDTETYISNKGLNNSSAKIIPPNSVIIAMYGETAGNVAINKKPLTTNQACCNLIIDSSIADYEYVYYVLCNLNSHILLLKNGGAQQNLSVSLIKNFSLPIFELEIQHEIAEILSTYDTLIENNTRRIAVLEKMAQELYKEWFVRFRFPGHEHVKMVNGVPEGWNIMSLSEITKIQYGFSFDGSLFNSKALGFPIVRIRDIPNGFSNDYTTETADSKYIVKSGDILVGMDGEFHINTWCGKDAFLVQRVCKISPKDPILAGYLFQAIYEPIKYFEKTIIGATVSHLGKKHLDSIQIICPDISLQSPLNEMFKLRQKLLEQNMALKVIRDLLLPRLMSGKLGVLNIEVHGLEKQIAENMKELW